MHPHKKSNHFSRDEYPIVGDVRGKGLMIAMEMVLDKDSRTPLDATTMMEIWDSCKEHGVILGRGGFYGNVSENLEL